MLTMLWMLAGGCALVCAWVLVDGYIRGESPAGPRIPRRAWKTYAAKIVADSISVHGNRITTFLLTIPKWLQAELNTHRAFSRNSSSSRAEPIMKRIRQVLFNPVVPIAWGSNRKGMVAGAELTGWRLELARETWFFARYPAMAASLALYYLGLHKQLANRVIEPWTWVDVVVTATEWENFFAQRVHPDAQPEIRYVAREMQDLLEFHSGNACLYRLDESGKMVPSGPCRLENGQWHLPFITYQEQITLPLRTQVKVAIARCARASYGYGQEFDWVKDLDLFRRLAEDDPPHYSPFEHVAQPLPGRHANLVGFISSRSLSELGFELDLAA